MATAIPAPALELIQTMLSNYDQWEVHSFNVSDDGLKITYSNAEISWFDDGDYCVTIHDKEMLTASAHEALEIASYEGSKR